MTPFQILLHEAICENEVSIAKELIAFLKVRNELDDNAYFIFLRLALINKKDELFEALWSDQVEVIFGHDRKFGNTLLHCAVLENNEKAVKLLLEFASHHATAGIDYINQINSKGETALHLALKKTNVNINLINRLVDAGADLYVLDDDSISPKDLIKNPNVIKISPELTDKHYHYKALNEQRINIMLTIDYLLKTLETLNQESTPSTSPHRIVAYLMPIAMIGGLTYIVRELASLSLKMLFNSTTKILLGTGGLLTSLYLYNRTEPLSKEKRTQITVGLINRLFYHSEMAVPKKIQDLIEKIKQQSDIKILSNLLREMIEDLKILRKNINLESHPYPR